MSENLFTTEIKNPREFVLNNARKLGWLMLLGSVVIALVAIAWPLWRASQGASAALVSFRGAMVAAAGFAMAPGYIIGGRRFVALVWPEPGHGRLTSFVMVVGTVVIAAGTYWLLRAWIASQGFAVGP